MSQTRARLLTISLCLAMALAACGKKPPPPPPMPPPPPPADTAPPPPPPPPPAPTPAPESRVPTEAELFERMTLAEVQKNVGDVFFALDSSDLADEARATLQKNADYLKKWASIRLTVEGHCDERGTAEYNLALGERRANAVRTYLTSLGVGADRTLVVSKGKEQPFCNERAESCYSQNRRGHFLITAK
jgi:peptidoglycan-associated lipoprotein